MKNNFINKYPSNVAPCDMMFQYGEYVERIYYSLYGKIPNILSRTISDGYVDTNKVKEEILNLLSKNVIVVSRQTISNKLDVQRLIKHVKQSDDEEQQYYRFIDNDKEIIVILYDYSTEIYYTSPNEELAVQIDNIVVNSIVDFVPKEAEFFLVNYNGQEFNLVSCKAKKVPELKLDRNYNDDFLPVHKDITDFLKDRESGVVLLNGTPGTGKTYYIRHLLAANPNKYIYITQDLIPQITSPNFISFIMKQKNSVLIVEDCESMLMSRSENPFGGSGVANILNMCDGLLSDALNIKFLCTFNTAIENIDEALLRKGRCFGNYKFGTITADKVKRISDEEGINIPEDKIKAMTLTEVYNYNDSSYSKVKPERKKIGFGN